MKTISQWFALMTPKEQDLYVKRLEERRYGKWFIDAWSEVVVPVSLYLALVNDTDTAFDEFRNRALAAITVEDVK